jgi:hypothetical protein
MIKTQTTNQYYPTTHELIAYLQLKGWNQIEIGNPRWYIFTGPNDINEKPLEIIIPKIVTASDMKQYINIAIELLSSLSNETTDLTSRKIQLYDRDILIIRNIEVENSNSISIKLAASQVHELKNLIAFSACSEHDPRPYFTSSQCVSSKDMIDEYRFGHTFKGSFGFTIEAPIYSSEMESVQLRLDNNATEVFSIPPIQRRVMERIARGLSNTLESTQKHDAEIIIDNFASGLNSNMCRSFINIAKPKKTNLEYSIIWSPRLPLSKDISIIEPIRLYEPSYDNLKYASDKLRELKNDRVKIIGRVVGLSSKDAPLSMKDIERFVVIRWTDRPDGRPINIIVALNKDEYVQAHKAHINWQRIEVRGVLRHVANIHKLSEPSGFKIIK